MGLDTVEFVMEVESAFGITLPDGDFAGVSTVGQLIDYLARTLPRSNVEYSLVDRAFVRLKQAIADQIGMSPVSIPPEGSLRDLFPDPDRDDVWARIGEKLGAKRWPRIGKRRWFSSSSSPKCDRTSQCVRFMMDEVPYAIKEPGEGWTRKQIADVVHPLIRSNFGLSEHEYTESSRFVEDLGLS